MKPVGPKPLTLSEEDDTHQLAQATKLISLTPNYDGPKNEPVVMPIYHSSTYYTTECTQFSKQMKEGFAYNRMRTPNHLELEMVLTEIENGKGTVVFPSGMGAVTNALMCFLRPGDHVIAQSPLYSCSTYVLNNILPEFGVEVTYVECTDGIDAYRKATKENTKMYYGESICNPMMWYLDIEKLAELGKEKGIMTVVDGTFSTPINQRPLDYGIDIVLHSCTKYMGGHSDFLGGSITVNTEERYAKLKTWQAYVGSCPSAFDCVLLTRSLRTLHIRMQRHNENGLAVAQYLEKHLKVKHVYYLGLTTHSQNSSAAKTMTGFSGMVSFEMHSYEASIKFSNSTKIFKLAVSLGGAESLIEHVCTMTHGDWVMSKEERADHKIHDALVRLSVGIEHIKDIIADLEQAFKKSDME